MGLSQIAWRDGGGPELYSYLSVAHPIPAALLRVVSLVNETAETEGSTGAKDWCLL